MSYETFNSTVKSGVGWLGEIPSHWAVVPAKALFFLRQEKALPDDVHLTPSQKFGVLPQVDYMEITGGRVVLNLMDSGQMKHVEPNDLISHLRSFQGGLELSRFRGKVSGAYTVLTPRSDQNPEFWKYALKSDTYIQALQTTTDQLRDGQSIRLKEFAQIPLPLVSRAEQDAIVYYLDSEIVKLEEMISLLAKIIAVAKERRQSLIQKSISTGLRAESLVETNISWIPQIPVTWRMMKLRYLVSSFIGLTYSPDEITVDEDMPLVLRAGNVKNGKLDFQDELRVTTLIPRDLLLKDGDILVCARSGSKALVGKSAYVENLKTPATFGAFMTVLRSPLGKYLYWVMNSELLPYQMGRFDSVTINQLTNSTLLDFEIPVPDQANMREISDYLDRETAVIDRQIELSENLMALTQARRESLISAAVTGKINVLGEVNG